MEEVRDASVGVVDLVSRAGRRGIRLWEDGGQLRFKAPSGALTADLKSELRRHKGEILDFLRQVSGAATSLEAPAIERVSRDGDLPLSFAQERLWLIDRLDPGNASYNIYDALELTGDLRRLSLERSLEEIFARHEVLRTTFRQRDGQPVLHVEDPGRVVVPRIDLSRLEPTDRRTTTQRLLDREAARGFDLEHGPLLRVHLVEHGSDRHVLLFNMHHIVSDGWSTGILVMELAAFYRSLTTGRPTSLPALPIQYADYAAWQRVWLTEERLEAQTDFWRDLLEDRPDSLELPVDRPHPPVRSSRGATHRFSLPSTVTAAVRRFSRRQGCTPFAVLLGAYLVALSRWTGQLDLVVGSPSANRDRTEIEGLIGFFVNTLALRVDLTGAPSFAQVVDRVRRRVLEAQEHRDLPFEKLVEELAPERSLARTPIFQTMFVFQNAPPAEMSAPGLELARLELDGGTTKMDLTLSLTDAEPTMPAEVEYATDLFDGTTIARLMGHYRCLLEGVLERPAAAWFEVPSMPAAERHQVLYEWVQGLDDADPERRVDELIAVHAHRQPDAVAVTLGNQALTFGELHRRAARLARELSRRGVGPETAVGIFLDRGPETLVAIFGVLQTGGTYVPLDPAYPDERLSFMLTEPGAGIMVTLERWRDVMERLGVEAVYLDTDGERLAALPETPPPGERVLDARAYVIYTSGSMGRPKGVVNSHRSLAAFARHYRAVSGHGPGDRHLLVLSFAFDASLGGVFPTLVGGATLVLHPNPAELPPRELTHLFERQQITCTDLPVPLWNHWVDELDATRETRGSRALPALRFLVAGGEPVYRERLDVWERQAGGDQPFWGAYGPTETTVAATMERTRGSRSIPLGRTRLPIGRPVPGVQARLLDARCEPVPAGVVGEICLSGDHLTRGYLNDPRGTASRFVPNLWGAPGSRMYRTGDFARHLADGRMEFLTRRDTQVKIRGFRVEPAEVEAALTKHPEVTLAAVVPIERDDATGKWLAAYVASRGEQAPTIQELREFLQESLPAYMVPGAFVVLDDLPRNPASGKVDVRGLPQPERRSSEEESVAPRTETEEVLVGLWEHVLGMDAVGVRDNFFELGGHSLLATRLMSRIGDALGVDVPLRQLFEAPTVEALARRIDGLRAAGTGPAPPPIERVPRDGPLPASYSQERMWLFERLHPGTPTYNTYRAGHVWGPLVFAGSEASYQDLLRRHEALRTRYVEAEGGAAQIVEPHCPEPLPLVDLTRLGEADRRAEAFRLAQSDAAHPISLETAPVSRARLLRLDRQEHVFLLSIHHIAYDLWSGGILLEEIEQLYLAHREGRPARLPLPPVEYADFAVWQRRWLTGEVLDAQMSYWKQRLDGLRDDPMELPTDRPRPAHEEHLGRSIYPRLGARVTEDFWALARQQGVTQFMATLAVFKVLLARWSGHHHVTVGTFMVNRNRSELERVVGYFDNTVVLHTDVTGDPTFLELLARVRQTTLGAHAHQYLPYESLVAELGKGDPQPLFRVAFIFELNYPAMERELAGLKVVPYNTHSGTAKFDVSLGFRDTPEGLVGELEHSLELFDATTADRMARQFARLLSAAVREPSRRLSELPLLGSAERWQLVGEWSGDRGEAGSETLHELVQRRAEAAPEAVALLPDEGPAVTRGDLATRAHRLARHLAGLGLGPETPVAVALERSPELVVTLLAILETGGIYVPIDADYPTERVEYLLADSGARVVVTLESSLERLPQGIKDLCVVCLDRDAAKISAQPPRPLDRMVEPESLAYVLYTSGSTGRPKGVAVPHRAVVRLVRDADFADLGGERTFLQLAPVAFDASTLEIWAPLTRGGRLALAPSGPVTPEILRRSLARHGVDTLWLTAALFHQVVDAGPDHLEGLRQLLAGGDVLSPAHCRAVLEANPGLTLINGYGPTENTTFTTCHAMASATEVEEPVSLGRPIAGTRVWVVDRHLRPVPVGVAGELVTGGRGLARGYWNRPARTARSFRPHPFSETPGERVYTTGDRVRWTADGRLRFLGRLDTQVKIRGFRIEPGEIEAVLEKLVGVRGAVVLALGGASEKRLVAYVTVESPGPSETDLRSSLRERVPRYMVPQSFVLLDSFPVTPNGKVDRRALADVQPRSSVREDGRYVPPADAVEEVLAEIWSSLLGRSPVGRTDDFFELGGHSLMATRLVSRVREVFGVEPSLERLFSTPTLAALAEEVHRARSRSGSQVPPLEPLPPESRQGPLPLSFAQSRLWFLDRLEPATAAYNIPGAVAVRGSVDAGRLRQVFTEVVRRHESLRTTLAADEGRPVQIVHPTTPIPLPVVDLRGLDTATIRAESLRRVDDDASRPFDLETGPLARFRLLRRGDDDHVLLLTQHHAVSDGWSMGVLLSELGALHGAFAEGCPSPLEELPIQYADYAVWQRSWLTGEVLAAEVEHWRERLTGAPALLELPTDRPRPPFQTYEGRTLPVALPSDVADAVSDAARRESASVFMVLLAAFQILLGRHAGQDDVVVGTPVAGRHRRKTEDLIGFFVNTLALRVDLTGEPSFREVLVRVRRSSLDAYAHQDVPFERLVEELVERRALSHAPLFQVMLALQNDPADVREVPGLVLEALEAESGTSKFDLLLALQAAGDGIEGSLEYNTDLFDSTTVRRLWRRFTVLLRQALATPERPVGELPWMPAAERQQVLREWNEDPPVGGGHGTLSGWLRATAREHPEAEALRVGEESFAYRELFSRVYRLARRLRRLGIGPEDRVGVGLPRDADLIVTLLAVLEAGGAYVPLDPAYPAERLAWVAEDAGLTACVSRTGVLPDLSLPGAVRLDLDREGDALAALPADPLPEPAPDPDRLAYLIYTSGSTGRPKGVAIEHRSAVALIRWAAATFTPRELSGVLAATSVSFDLSVFEIFVPLALGGRILLARDALALATLPARDEVRLVNTVPSAMIELTRSGALPDAVETVNLAGEPLKRALVDAVHEARPGCRVLNLYGPSEDTTYSTGTVVPAGGGEPTIGRPLAGSVARVLGRDLRPVASGVVGELYLEGAGLARGYFGQPARTAERFVPAVFGHGSRMYRTGDLVRWLADGELEFLGRGDHQVKVRGFRIELGEIEAALVRHEDVREAAALARGEGADRRLEAWVVADTEAAELRAELSSRLPGHMVPSAFHVVPELPLTPNGKIDRNALARWDQGALAGEDVVDPPADPVEEVLAEIWCHVLGREEVGTNQDFFLLGGHSLLAAGMAARVEEAFGVELPLRQLFETPTVAELARFVRREAGRPAAPPLVARGRSEGPLTRLEEALWRRTREDPHPAHHLINAERAQGSLTLGFARQVLAEVIRRHEGLRTVFLVDEGGRPRRRVVRAEVPRVPAVDLTRLDPACREREMRRRLGREARRGFSIEVLPARRFALLREDPESHVLLVAVHRLVADGWSLDDVLLPELAALMSAYRRGLPSPLPEPPVQPGDVALWERSHIPDDAFGQGLAAWREAMAGLPGVASLPPDREQAMRTEPSRALPIRLPTSLARDLGRLARTEGATLFMVLLAAFAARLAAVSGHDDVLLGSLVAGRRRRELEGLIGTFVDVVPVRMDVSGEPTFRRLVRRVRRAVLDGFARPRVPLDTLVDEGIVPRPRAVFNLKSAPEASMDLPGLRLEESGLEVPWMEEDLRLGLLGDETGLRGKVQYAADVYAETTIDAFIQGWIDLLEGAVAEPDGLLRDLPRRSGP